MRRLPRNGSIRNVVTGRSDGYTGRVPFARLLTTCAYESLLSGDFLLLTSAFEPDVAKIDSEPFRLSLLTDTGESYWTPDYRILRNSGARELIEVKPVKCVHPERDKLRGRGPDKASDPTARYEWMRQAANAAGYKFRLVTEDQIRVEPRLGNAALILRCAALMFPPAWLLQARKALAAHPITDVPSLQAHFPPTIDVFPIALQLAYLGELEIDPTRSFGRQSRFARVGHRLLDLFPNR
ncbi:MAG: hypothetical protein ACYC5H_06430 [Methylovirgula sp.]